MRAMSTKEIDPVMLALDEVVMIAGGSAKLAKYLGIAASTISMWRMRGVVPGRHCVAIYKLTGVLPQRLNPAVFGIE